MRQNTLQFFLNILVHFLSFFITFFYSTNILQPTLLLFQSMLYYKHLFFIIFVLSFHTLFLFSFCFDILLLSLPFSLSTPLSLGLSLLWTQVSLFSPNTQIIYFSYTFSIFVLFFYLLYISSYFLLSYQTSPFFFTLHFPSSIFHATTCIKIIYFLNSFTLYTCSFLTY